MTLPTNLTHYLLLTVVTLVGVTLIWLAVIIGFRLFQWRRVLRRKSVFLELTPPAHTARAPHATQELFTVIHGFRASRTLRQKLLRRDVLLSFEIASTRAGGIRYIIQADERLAGSLQQAITAYLPQIKVAEVKGGLPDGLQIMEFKQKGHYAFPLASTYSLEHHDPIAYLAGAMTKLAPDEQIRIQLVLTPVELKEAKTLARRILNNEDLLSHLSHRKIPFAAGIAGFINDGLFAATEIVGETFHGQTKGMYNSSHGSSRANYERMQISTRKRPARTLSAFEMELMETMHQKLNQPLFRVSIRVAVRMDNVDAARERLGAIRTSLQAYNVPSYQALQAKTGLLLPKRLRRFAFNNRLPALFNRRSIVLSSSELANLYHFPLGNTSQTDNLITSLSRTLAAPVSLKSGRKLAVTIGDNHHHNVVTPIGLTDSERERHLYIIGGTGNGKTTMLFYSILQDIRAGNGVAVLDPHGDLAERILRYIPEDRIKDVIYMNPDDLAYPVGVNLLELPEGLAGDDLLREKDLVTEATISVLRKIFSDDDSGGHRIEYVLRNSIQTVLTLENPTLFTIFELLNDAKFRRKVVKTLTDKNLKDFWDNELGKAGEFQRVKMAAGITAKIGRFLFSASARRVLEQPKSTINFEDILASKKILICNFSKGMLGEDTSALFGTTVLAKIQTAALRRARVGEQNRVPFYLYVDEFQNFATMGFVQMLSEARKYKLFLTMAEQSTSQQDQQRLVDIILANVGTIVCFRSGSPADERLVLPLFSPFIDQGEIANLPAYSYYARIAAIDAQEPMSGVTVVVEDKGSEAIARRVVESSRLLYAKKLVVESDTNKVKAPSKSKGTRSTTKRPSRKQSEGLKAETSLK
ncbi:MAG TPA: type IV secretion system DNA-binding domain-containing protein [Candidatus Saccharimonadales bacterium]|nr:type IV secretion system DNA-binding domain-containing protein [Candidatus Saccharimonadales bacterium]